MRFITWITIFCIAFSLNGLVHSEEVETVKKKNTSSGNEALTGAIMGGLLGAGVGAAIGSASGKAGQGAAIGAGVGALGGTVMGADRAARRAREEESGIEVEDREAETPKNIKIKKRIIREYDEEGNIISEREVKN